MSLQRSRSGRTTKGKNGENSLYCFLFPLISCPQQYPLPPCPATRMYRRIRALFLTKDVSSWLFSHTVTRKHDDICLPYLLLKLSYSRENKHLSKNLIFKKALWVQFVTCTHHRILTRFLWKNLLLWKILLIFSAVAFLFFSGIKFPLPQKGDLLLSVTLCPKRDIRVKDNYMVATPWSLPSFMVHFTLNGTMIY